MIIQLPSHRAVFLLTALSIIMAGVFLPPHVKAASVLLHIPEKYESIKPGERLYFQVDISYPENVGRKDLLMKYRIFKNNSEIVASQFLKAVESQISFTDYALIPESAPKGLYTISLSISDADGKNIWSDVSTTFQMLSSHDMLTVYFGILLVAIVAVGGIIVWEIKHNP